MKHQVSIAVVVSIALLAGSSLAAPVGSPYYTAVRADNPLVYYGFDEAAGPTAADLSVNGRNGTYGNTYTLSQASALAGLGTAVLFNSGNVAVPALGTLSQVSLEYWIRPTSTTGDFRAMYDVDGWYGAAMHNQFYNGNNRLSVSGNGGGDDKDFGGIALNTWQHVVLTYDSASRTAIEYINGVAQPAQTWTSAQSVILNAAHIGQWNGNSRPFLGTMDEFAMYGTALSAAQVLAHYNAIVPPTTGTVFLPASGNWNQGANWSVGSVPVANNIVGIHSGRAATIDANAGTIDTLYMSRQNAGYGTGGTGASTLNIVSGGSLTVAGTTDWSYLGQGANGQPACDATLNVSGTGSITFNNKPVIMYWGSSNAGNRAGDGSATVNVSDTATANFNGGLVFNYGTGNLNVSGGTVNVGSSAFANGMESQQAGVQNIALSGGTVNTTRFALRGTSTWTLSGGNLNATQRSFFGGTDTARGTANVTHTAGIVNVANDLFFTWDPGDVCNYNLSGTGQITANQVYFRFGDNTFNQSGGSTFLTNRMSLGEGGSGAHTSTYNLSGGTVNVNGSGNRTFIGGTGAGGYGGRGIVNQTGGTFNAQGRLFIAWDTTDFGQYNISGGQLNVGENIHMRFGNADLNISGTAQVNVAADLVIGEGGSGTPATVDVTGGELNVGGGIYVGMQVGLPSVAGSEGLLTVTGGVVTAGDLFFGSDPTDDLVIGGSGFVRVQQSNYSVADAFGDMAGGRINWTEVRTVTVGNVTFTEMSVPEPATMALVGLCLAGLGRYVRRRR